MLPQGDARVLKRHSQAKRAIMGESLARLDRTADEQQHHFWNSQAQLADFRNSFGTPGAFLRL
jgi:hypothetical protein